MTLGIGLLVYNRYRIEVIIATGGMGAIYQAKDESLGIRVAIKENLIFSEEATRQFRREATLLAGLRHPNLPRVTDHFSFSDQGQYLVMDYIEGEDLRQRLGRLGKLGEEEVIAIGAAICDALAYLHSRTPPVIHRDIKPGNIKITPGGQVFLVDFGLAKISQAGQATTTGAQALTPGYASPEQYGQGTTPLSDLYALGATLYAGLTGRIPEDALARAMGTANLGGVRRYNPLVSERTAAVIERAMAVKAEDRYPSAQELRLALVTATEATTRLDSARTGLTPAATIQRQAPEAATRLAGPPASPSSPPSGQPPVPGTAPQGSLSGPPSRPPAGESRPSAPIFQGSLAVPPPGPPPGQDSGAAIAARPPARRGRSLGRLALVCVLLAGAAGAVYLLTRPPAVAPPPVPTQSRPSTTPQGGANATPQGGANATPQGGAAATSEPSPRPATRTLPALANLTASVSPSPAASLTSTFTPQPAVPPTITPTLPPAVTPNGGGSGQVAFVSNRGGLPQVWLMNADGTGQQQVSGLADGACQPAWSPDGKRLAVVSPCRSRQAAYAGSSLFLLNADGSGLTPLPSVPGGDYEPTWSADGKQIAFSSLREGSPHIYVLTLENNKTTRLTGAFSNDFSPAWSPDGKSIAFLSTRLGDQQVWVMDANGANPGEVTLLANGPAYAPAWSADSQYLIFLRNASLPNLYIKPARPLTANETKIALASQAVQNAHYSIDGLWIVFESWKDGNHDIYRMTPNGSALTRLTSDGEQDYDAVWRP